jgi:hypothetical protein
MVVAGNMYSNACRGRYNTFIKRLQRQIQYFYRAPAEADIILL